MRSLSFRPKSSTSAEWSSYQSSNSARLLRLVPLSDNSPSLAMRVDAHGIHRTDGRPLPCNSHCDIDDEADATKNRVLKLRKCGLLRMPASPIGSPSLTVPARLQGVWKGFAMTPLVF